MYKLNCVAISSEKSMCAKVYCYVTSVILINVSAPMRQWIEWTLYCRLFVKARLSLIALIPHIALTRRYAVFSVILSSVCYQWLKRPLEVIAIIGSLVGLLLMLERARVIYKHVFVLHRFWDNFEKIANFFNRTPAFHASNDHVPPDFLKICLVLKS